jgi:hypothetical protein
MASELVATQPGRGVVENLNCRPFVFRTEVKKYYASIDHDVLMAQWRSRIQDGIVLSLTWRCLRHDIYLDGVYQRVQTGDRPWLSAIAPETREKFLVCLSSLIRLYEQGAFKSDDIGQALKRFYIWVYSGLKQVPGESICLPRSASAFIDSAPRPLSGPKRPG